MKYEYVKLQSVHIRQHGAGLTLCGLYTKDRAIFDPLSGKAAYLCKTCARIKQSQEAKEQ